MKNVWKGLVVGGLTGVTAGIVLDSFTRAPEKARDLTRQVREHAPEAGRWVHSVAERAGEIVNDSDAPDVIRDTVRRVKDSPTAKTAAKTAAKVTSDAATAAKDAAASIKH
jgi:hypothetical protein